MLKSVTQGTSSDSIILVATVVLPDALPPQIPAKYQILENCFHFEYLNFVCCKYEIFKFCFFTNYKRFNLLPCKIIPGRSSSSVDCSMFTSQNRFGSSFLIRLGHACRAMPSRMR